MHGQNHIKFNELDVLTECLFHRRSFTHLLVLFVIQFVSHIGGLLFIHTSYTLPSHSGVPPPGLLSHLCLFMVCGEVTITGACLFPEFRFSYTSYHSAHAPTSSVSKSWYIRLIWGPSWSSGQNFWLLITRSRVRFPALPWGFSLWERIPVVTMVWVVGRIRFKVET